MTNIFLFGSSTETGKFIKNNFDKRKIENINLYSFSNKKESKNYLNLKSFNFPNTINTKEESVFISLAPIWLFIPFIEKFLKKYQETNILGLIVISSTSSITKKYSWNKFDKELSSKLLFWENRLFKLNHYYKINTTLIRPTMIYGDIGKHKDKNISFLLSLMRYSFIILIPHETGKRQPIHYSQLGSCILKISKKYLKKTYYKDQTEILNIGGDDELTYFSMLKKIKENLTIKDNAKNCIILKIPNRLYFVLTLPILIFSPKIFEAIQRISIDMNGFEKSYKITGRKKQTFPVKIEN